MLDILSGLVALEYSLRLSLGSAVLTAQAGELIPSPQDPQVAEGYGKEARTTKTWFCTKPEIFLLF